MTHPKERAGRRRRKQGRSSLYRRLPIVALGVVTLSTAAWIGWRQLHATNAPSVQSSSSFVAGEAKPGAQKGDVAPEFSVPTLAGDTFRLSDQLGKPAIVYFMAYWCGSCIPEAQALGRIKQQYGNRVHVLALDVDPSSTPQGLSRFKAAVGNPAYTWGFDTGQKVAQTYDVYSLDTTIIIDASGRIAYLGRAPMSYEQLDAVLAPLVEARGS